MNKRILLIEDNILLSETVKELLELNGYKEIMTTKSGLNIENLIKEYIPNLILMDIRLEEEEDGIDLAKKVREMAHIPIIFITSFSDSRIIGKVKEVKPEGFIIKPFSQETLTTTIDLVINKFYSEEKPQPIQSLQLFLEGTFFIRDRGWLKKINIKDILYLKTEGTYTHIVTDTQNFTLRSPIKDIAPNLPDEYFKRVHKSFIVNINKIDALTSKELKIKEEIIPIGRNYYAELQKIICKLNENDT